MFLDKAGVAYDKLMADENPELVALYGVKQAPTLVVISGDEYQTIPNLSNIKAYAEKK
jgi:ribonucleoside-triphosphate reductase